MSLAGRSAGPRSDACPEVAPPPAPAFHAFCFTVPDAGAAPPSFVVAGSGEAAAGHANYRDRTVALGDTSPTGLREKARWVLGEMERRMAALGGFGWADTTAVQAYTVHDIHPFSARSWPAAAPSGTASPGSSAARRCAASNTGWTAAASRWSACCSGVSVWPLDRSARQPHQTLGTGQISN